jgi:hypothetical protein
MSIFKSIPVREKRWFKESITNVPNTPATTPVTTRSIAPPMPVHEISYQYLKISQITNIEITTD